MAQDSVEQSLLGIATGDDVARKLEEIWGETPENEAGVVHVTAVWRSPTGRYRTLHIRDDTPRSAHDVFMLGVSRARADAIVTTGKILREEPSAVHDLPGGQRLAAALMDWRQRVLGRRDPPLVVVLTSGRGLDPRHPAFGGLARPMIYTGMDTVERLHSELADTRIAVVGSDHPGLRDAIAYLGREAGCRTISVEAGPSTSQQLYDPPAAVDELMLSVYLGSSLPEDVVGTPFLDINRLQSVFDRWTIDYHAAETSGEWSFSRWRR